MTFAPSKIQALNLLHGEDFVAQLISSSAKDASDLNEAAVIRKAKKAKDATDATDATFSGDTTTPVADTTISAPVVPVTTVPETVAEVPEDFEGNVVAGFQAMTTQLTAISAQLVGLAGRVDDVEKSVNASQAANGSSRATLASWLAENAKSATETPAATEADPLLNSKPKAVDPTQDHMLGGL